MATKTAPTPQIETNVETQDIAAQLSNVGLQGQKLLLDFMEKHGSFDATGFGKFGDAASSMGDNMAIMQMFSDVWQKMMSNPGDVWQAQMDLWGNYMQLWQNSASRFFGGEEVTPLVQPDKGDRRFRDDAWSENAVFDFIKQSYLLYANWTETLVENVDGLTDQERRKIEFYTRQFVDALSPSNYAMTNPQVLKATLESNGENLLSGLKNLLTDVEHGRISMTDYEAFTVGENIATSEGKVVYENELMQLIQYTPSTKEVFKTPLLITPPWINKFYILDLQPKNSMIKWLVDQGHTVFVISWANPDEKMSNTGFEDYMVKGPMAALDAIEKATGEKQTNVIGYCIGGTLLASMLAVMAEKGDTRVKSATYFTTLVDFSDPGDLAVFIDEEQLTSLEKRMSETGYLEGRDMALTFNLLRANDLIWSFVVNNYLLGKEPFPFDLLYWNGDATRLPAPMHSFYLRKMYQENKLIQKGGLCLQGVDIDVSKIKTPSFLLSTHDDHIAPWQTTYTATQYYSGPVKFVLSGSGHIAGVINPPVKEKYGYWTNDKLPKNPDAWLKAAKKNEGSWWPEWQKWVKKYAGDKVEVGKAKRQPGAGKLKAIEAAPGRYVQVKY